eukprot:scaffold45777_cov31-Tisochrysis_lutea.AAC.3
MHQYNWDAPPARTCIGQQPCRHALDPPTADPSDEQQHGCEVRHSTCFLKHCACCLECPVDPFFCPHAKPHPVSEKLTSPRVPKALYHPVSFTKLNLTVTACILATSVASLESHRRRAA